jgi:hypothetical protein
MELWCGDYKGSFVMFGAFFINVEISTNRLTSTSRKIGTQPLIRGCWGRERQWPSPVVEGVGGGGGGGGHR